MSFRTRISVLLAATAVVSVAIASIAVYVLVRAQMLGQVDATLRDRVGSVGFGVQVFAAPGLDGAAAAGSAVPLAGGSIGAGTGCFLTATGGPQAGTSGAQQQSGTVSGECPRVLVSGLVPPPLGGAGGYTQIIDAQGRVALTPGEQQALPVSAQDMQVAASGQPQVILETAVVNGVPLRIATTSILGGKALQVARPLDEVESVLARLRWILAGICLAVLAVAGLGGRLLARRTLRPVDRLMTATEHVAGTQDLRRRIEEPGRDELGRLAHSFNRMLEALDQSQRTQRQLVADASHELRTPLSSLRTNIEVLARADRIDAPERDRMLADVLGQVERLSTLVADLVDLARGDEPSSQVRADVALDEVVAQQVEVARTHFPDVRFSLSAEPAVVEGDPQRIGRAVANLLDNAGKWSPAGAVVEVAVGGAEVTVRDHGPGIAPQHVPHVFQRFWRAPGARQRPGSGLGLAIVQQVALSHEGDVAVESPPGGGALLRLRLHSVS
jgi:two-component system sensor histidine kinase MprB